MGILDRAPETTFYEQIYIPLTSAHSKMFPFLLITIAPHTDILWLTELKKFCQGSKKMDTLIFFFFAGEEVLYVLEINSLKKNVLNRERDWQSILPRFPPNTRSFRVFLFVCFKLASVKGFGSVEVQRGLVWGWNEVWLYTRKLSHEFAWIICLANKR